MLACSSNYYFFTDDRANFKKFSGFIQCCLKIVYWARLINVALALPIIGFLKPRGRSVIGEPYMAWIHYAVLNNPLRPMCCFYDNPLCRFFLSLNIASFA